MRMPTWQNFCSRVNFDAVWLRTRKSRPKMAIKFRERLHDAQPDLYERTRVLEQTPDTAVAGSNTDPNPTTTQNT